MYIKYSINMKLKVLFALFIFITACSSESSKEKIRKPSHFLKQNEMVEVSVDFRLTEAAIRQMAGYGEDTKKLSKYYYGKVLKKHHLSAKEYEENLVYYAKNPEKLHQVSSRVVARLTEIQTELSTQK